MTEKQRYWLIFFIILILAILSRLLLLALRPLHHDEGNNYYFAQRIIDTGLFVYDYTNYHGPFYFFMIFLSFITLGVSEFSLRLPAALSGIGMILLVLYFWKKDKNKYGVKNSGLLFASLLLLTSPSLLYYSRYSIHESSFAFFSVALVFLITFFLKEKNYAILPYIAFVTALMLATKETAIIVLALAFLIIIINYKSLPKIEWEKNQIYIWASLYLFLLIYISLFTSFFANPKGLLDSFRAFFPWIQRSSTDVGHIKPLYYYLKLILSYEAPILLFATFGIFSSFKTKNIIAKNFSIYFLGILAVYSLIPYKMPWIVINITAPMCILAGYGLSILTSKKIKIAVGTLSIMLLAGMSIYLNFINPWQQDNLYAYVHTDKSIIQMIKKINSLYKDDSRILIVSDEYWPLPFYFHKKNVAYQSNVASIDVGNSPEYDFFIIKNDVYQQSIIPENYISERYYLRPGVELYLVYKKPSHLIYR